MKLQHLFAPLLADFKTVIEARALNWQRLDHGNGLKACYCILDKISANRAYDDSHPMWKTQKRILPYDGRHCCFYYANGANDSHLETLLKAIKAELDKTS